MRRHRVSAALLGFGLVVAVAAIPGRLGLAADPPPPSAPAASQQAAPSVQAQAALAASQPQVAILQALRANPVTAPYRFAVVPWGKQQYALSGRVGTKYIHDVAIRTVIALGYPVRDDLVIDTGEVNRLAAEAVMSMGPGPGASGPPLLPSTSGLGYVYPPPLFGRLDDPFFGFEPPLFSFPPWWGAMSAYREPRTLLAMNGPGSGQAAAGPAAAAAPAQAAPQASTIGFAPAAGPVAPAGPGAAQPAANASGLADNPIELTLDTQGVAVLRGNVPTLADRVAVGQEVARTPGITQVVNLLQVTGNVPAPTDVPPPPPTPAVPPAPAPAPRAPAANAGQPAEGAPIAVDGEVLTRRVADALGRRPALAALPLRVATRAGVATLSGRVPSSYEAMLAFRAAQQTPGVREVVDRLEIPLPDVGAPNPLREKGRPEDVEAYLLAQIRHQVGDLAHVDQVHLQGDSLEVRGTVTRADDTPRVEAALRSIPLLRGFRLEPSFLAE
jgi:hypothetical protein